MHLALSKNIGVNRHGSNTPYTSRIYYAREMLLSERFHSNFLQVESGKQQRFADGSLCSKAFRALVLLPKKRNPTKQK